VQEEASMKKLFMVLPLVLILCFMVGCQDKEAMAELEAMKAQAAVEEQNIELTKSWLVDVWSQGNLALIDKIVPPNCILHWRGRQSETGPEKWKTIVSQWCQAFPDYTNEIGDIFAKGDKVTARFTFRRTNDGPFNEDPPTGKKIDVTEILIWRFKNGKVVEM
jgi:hypothetical protein